MERSMVCCALIKMISEDASLIISVLAMIAAMVAGLAAWMQYRIVQKKESDQMAPFLYPIKDEFCKNRWVRYDVDGMLPGDSVKIVEKEKYTAEDEGYIRFCRDEKNYGKAFFYQKQGELLFVLNGYNNSPGMYIEHYNMKLTFKNYGSLITKIHVDYVKVFFRNYNKKPKVYAGLEESAYTDVILPNGELVLILDEVTSIDDDGSSCRIPKEKYAALCDFDLFNMNALPVLNYEAFEIVFSAWNENNEKYSYKILIRQVGNQFQREITRLKHPYKWKMS